MNTSIRGHTASWLGRSFGRGWRACARCERWVFEWLVSKGVPAAGATALLWAVKLAVLGMLLYFVFWLALALLLGLVGAWIVGNSTESFREQVQLEDLRSGEAGFGLYSTSGERIDPHDPNNPFDD